MLRIISGLSEQPYDLFPIFFPDLVILEAYVKVEPPSAWVPVRLSSTVCLQNIRHVT